MTSGELVRIAEDIEFTLRYLTRGEAVGGLAESYLEVAQSVQKGIEEGKLL